MEPLPSRLAAAQLFRDAAGRYRAHYGDWRFSSVFQPVFYRGGGLFGHEALLRVDNAAGQRPPPDLFFSSLAPEQAAEADRLARLIHVRNYAQSGESGCLCLNLLSQTAIGDNHSGRAHLPLLQGMLETLEMDRGGVIFELLEYELEHHGQQLLDPLRRASDAGFGLAVDDFGGMGGPQARVTALCPDVIKIDRSLLLDYMAGDQSRLPAMLEYGWRIGSRMLVEGIESAEQHQAMQALGVELYQGYHLGRPAELPVRRQL
nr:EAL domain-containing protein [Chromobacterium sp. ASV5]